MAFFLSIGTLGGAVVAGAADLLLVDADGGGDLVNLLDWAKGFAVA